MRTERLVTWPCWDIDWKVELVETTMVISHCFCDIDFKEVIIWSLIVRSDSCDWRCGRISRWTGFREKRQQSDKRLSRQQWSETVAEVVTCSLLMLKIASRWQSVNQWKSTTMATSSEDSGSTEQIASSWDEHASVSERACGGLTCQFPGSGPMLDN